MKITVTIVQNGPHRWTNATRDYIREINRKLSN